MTQSGWVDVTEPYRLAETLGVDASSVDRNALSAIRTLTGPNTYLKTALERPRLSSDELMHFEVLKSRLFINWTEAKKVRDDIVIFGILYGVSQNLPLTTLVGAARKLKETVRILNADETEVVRVIIGIAAPASAYAVGVPEDQVKSAYRDAAVDIDQLLDSLEIKKILRKERVGKLRLVV